MNYLLNDFKIKVDDKRDLKNILKSHLKIDDFEYEIYHKSIDARKKDNIYFVYKIIIKTNKKLNLKLFEKPNINLDYKKWSGLSPIIVGFGPAGIFCALYLARCGANPIIIERGSKIEDRENDLKIFLEKRILNPESNVQFGEGGAGTFSDGKLVTNLNDPLIRFILNEFYIHGAKEDILYESHPHIGTDYLAKVVKNIREEIISLGGKFYFNHTFINVKKNDDIINIIIKNNKNDENINLNTNNLILALGHSAKDTVRYLYNDLKLDMMQKQFSMGVRIEHLKEKIDIAQYGKFYKLLPSSYYKLATHNNGRGIYTFCMCPGGYVLASTSDEKSIVTNGMSNNKRDNINSNSAILVDVRPDDYNISNSPLDGILYQEKYEKLAYEISKDYKAPANLVKEFLQGSVAKDVRSIKTSYPHGIIMNDLSFLPDFVIDNLKYGIKEFDKKIKGFADDDAIIIAPETRSSSAVRILRNKDFESNIKGIYPVGEGAGYAGGITSSALDGLKCAISISNKNI